jgi:hypothetical protein
MSKNNDKCILCFSAKYYGVIIITSRKIILQSRGINISFTSYTRFATAEYDMTYQFNQEMRSCWFARYGSSSIESCIEHCFIGTAQRLNISSHVLWSFFYSYCVVSPAKLCNNWVVSSWKWSYVLWSFFHSRCVRVLLNFVIIEL